jgi:hypothetical protein
MAWTESALSQKRTNARLLVISLHCMVNGTSDVRYSSVNLDLGRLIVSDEFNNNTVFGVALVIGAVIFLSSLLGIILSL